MIIGLIAIGGVLGAGSALTALMMGHSIWMAILVYSAIGSLSALVGALVVSLRKELDSQTDTTISYSIAPQQRG